MASLTTQSALGRRAFRGVVHIAAAMLAATAGAQDTSAVARHSATPRGVFSRADAVSASRFLIATAILLPLDQSITRAVGISPSRGAGVERVAAGVDQLAFPGSFTASYAVFGAGVLMAREDWMGAGWHTFAAVSAATSTANLVKRAIGRARPTAALGATHFDVGGGGQAATSYAFPSAHTAAAFAAASALSEELGARSSSAARFAGPALYGLASAVAVSRVVRRAHWASDVIAGAALGTFAGRGVVRLSRAHPRNWADRVIVHAVFVCDERGRAAIGWHW